jgi:hypothetical protein
MPKGKTDSIEWTGKNLAEVKRFHKNVAHYPREKGDESYRDASQHPDNLHLTREDGTTLIAALGDTITKDADGRITVEQTGKRPVATGKMFGRVIAAEASDGVRARAKTNPKGGTS